MTTPREQTKTAAATATAKALVAKPHSSPAPIKAKPARKTTRTKKASPARPGTKTAKVLGLPNRAGGVTLKELMKATGWQAHSVRGFLSGALGKKMGTSVESFQSATGRADLPLRFQVVAPIAPPAAHLRPRQIPVVRRNHLFAGAYVSSRCVEPVETC